MEKNIVEEYFHGECLEGIGFPTKGIAVIDKKIKPCVFDIVHCNDCACSVSGYLKQIVRTGEKPIVRTCYKDPTKDFIFFAREIYGTVICVMDENRNVLWERRNPVEYAPLEKAIKMLESEYERATCLEFVHSPLAYALYQVWKKVERESGATDG